MPTLAELRNHLTRAVYSLPFSGDLVKDVAFKDQSFRIHLKPRVPYGYTADLTRRLGNIDGVVLSGMDTSSAEILIRGHFDPKSLKLY